MTFGLQEILAEERNKELSFSTGKYGEGILLFNKIYTCKVENLYGADSFNFTVNVEGTDK
jgi:hypothetical protein